METVWVVTWDGGEEYGSGLSGVFSTEEKAAAFVESKKGSYYSYSYEEVTVDELVK